MGNGRSGEEIRTSRGRRACRARKPRKSGEFRTEHGEVGTAAESRNDPQEPNLTGESGNRSRSRPRGIARRERRPRLSASGRQVEDVGFGAALAAPPAQAALFEEARGVGPVRPLVPANVASGSKGKCERGDLNPQVHLQLLRFFAVLPGKNGQEGADLPPPGAAALGR
jgi:hypothetical protein